MPSVRWPTEGQATAACEHRACSARAPRLPSDPFKFNFNNFRARFFFHPSSRGCPSPMFWYVGLRSSAAGDIMPSERRSMPCGGPQPPFPTAPVPSSTPQLPKRGRMAQLCAAPRRRGWVVGLGLSPAAPCSGAREAGGAPRAARNAARGRKRKRDTATHTQKRETRPGLARARRGAARAADSQRFEGG